MKPTPGTSLTGTPEPPQKIAVIGLGYVGLPLAVALAKRFDVVGFDIDSTRIEQLRCLADRTGEVSAADLKAANILLTDDARNMVGLRNFIVTVPTPVDEQNHPDLKALESACVTVGLSMAVGSLVVFESTVYPGCTEEFCVPILETTSAMKCNQEFVVAYSPERVNPGDPDHRLTTIDKIVGGSTPEARSRAAGIYATIMERENSVHQVSSIRVAEAAKAIENAQRDINIAFVNELAMMFDRIGIDTQEVPPAARTKWNFLDFRPGLVGGHCIGVDPYYLAHSAQKYGYHPEMILSGRRVNESVAGFVARRLFKRMVSNRAVSFGKRDVLILGATFKENCPDTRNSKVPDIVRELSELGCDVTIYDPLVPQFAGDPSSIYRGCWDGILLAVPHKDFDDIEWDIICDPSTAVFDLKGAMPDGIADDCL